MSTASQSTSYTANVKNVHSHFRLSSYLPDIIQNAIKTITRRWLHKDPPTVREWLSIINNIQHMEQLTFSLRLQKDKGDAFRRKWDKDNYMQRGNNLS